MLFWVMTGLFLRPLTIHGYILLIIWLAVLPQHPSHMHSQTTTWIGLCVSPIHLLLLVQKNDKTAGPNQSHDLECIA